jgi:GT2 family glycosyltransferase
MIQNMSNPKVTAVIVNWNSYRDTKSCIESLNNMSYDRLDIVLVDNGSTDASVQKLQNKFTEIETVILEENGGFSSGSNEGIKEALLNKTDYIWLVNSDIVFNEPDVLGSLVKTMEANEDIGLLSPLITHYPQTDTLWFRRGLVKRTSALTYTDTKYRWYLHGSKTTPAINDKPDQSLIANDYLPNACSLLRSKLIDEIGLLEERYFLYKEDVDYSLKAIERNYLVMTQTNVGVAHKVTASSGGAYNPTHTYYNIRNRWLLKRERLGGPTVMFYLWTLYWIILLSGYLLYQGKYSSVSALFQGVRDGYLGRFGKGPYPKDN